MNNSRIQNKRQKIREERKRVARICVSKLQNIHDPESYLCKSVLINNTLRNIQLQHRESLKRTRLHRENFPKDQDDFEAKRQCLEGGTTEEQLEEDVGHSLCNSYYNVSPGDRGDDVILCDTFSQTDISSTVDISLTTTTTTNSLGDIEEESLNNNNSDCDPGKGGTFQVTYCIDTMTQPQTYVQNNTITLKSF